jgi:Tfp pilus assembly protein PilW
VVARPLGFTLVEFVVATAVVLLALSLAVALVVPATGACLTLPESTDLQQRVRVAAETLRADIAAAGNGFSLAWGASGSAAWPPVVPCRWTTATLSAVPGGCAASDSLTVLSMPAVAPQAITEATLTDLTAPIRIAAASACSLERAACRLHVGAPMLLADGTSAFDVFTASAVSSDGTLIAHGPGRLSGAYATGALLGEVSVRSYALGADSETGAPQLRRTDWGGASQPVTDHVVTLTFQYFGEALPPEMVNPDDHARRTTTYGPVPPPLGVDHPFDSWPAGENCVFHVDGERQVSRLQTLVSETTGLAPLPIASLADGPWCPDTASPNRYDADLLRVRLIRITLRGQAQSTGVRGRVLGWFAHPGEARDLSKWVPDLEVSVDVALRSTWR